MKSSIKIGRDNSNDIVINEPRVSRNHAIVTSLGNDTFEVKDLGSTNGTFVNGQRINQKIIIPGDKLEVSGCIVNWYDAFINPKKTSIIQEKAFAKIRKTISVGSASQNDLVLSSSFVTNKHAKISLLKKGTFYIQDLGSSNGTFVNGTRVMAKNFTKTDIVKIASEDLPQNWFLHKNFKPHFIRDHKRTLFIILLLLIIIPSSLLAYLNSCKWFDCRCDLTSEQIYSINKNCVVYIEHSYFYTIEADGKTFFVGKNKDFKGTEANTSKENLLPYATVLGSGCFIKVDGTILTSKLITTPWFNKEEINKMLREVADSRTIRHFSLQEHYTICGETAELKWLTNGTVNNPQNYIAASIEKECTLNDKTLAIIQSVKRTLPKNTSVLKFYFDQESKDRFHNTSSYHYSYIFPLKENEVMKDTFYSSKFATNINNSDVIPFHRSLPALTEGSIMINERGELVGIVQQQQVVFLHRFSKQLIQ